MSPDADAAEGPAAEAGASADGGAREWERRDGGAVRMGRREEDAQAESDGARGAGRGGQQAIDDVDVYRRGTKRWRLGGMAGERCDATRLSIVDRPQNRAQPQPIIHREGV